ncbi:MAG: hypothetical protein WBQ44_16310 [Rhodococcus sp. (in: high G+C Gram-positive bacteria)]
MASTHEFAFPADRAARTTLLTGSAPAERARFWALSDHIAYPDIKNIVADYINATIPDPAATQGRGWTVAALPPAHRAGTERRLLTLTCGTLDTVVVTEFAGEDDSIELEMTVETAVPDGFSDERLTVSNEVVTAARGTHGTHETWTWRIDLGALLTDDAEVDFGIEDDMFDDLAYALNISLLHEADADTAEHSDDLAADLLAEAYRQLVDQQSANS